MKKVLKLTSIVLMIVILAGMIISTNAYAVEGCDIELKSTKTQVQKQEEFEVNVNIANINSERGIISLSGVIEYDKTSLTLVKMEGKNGWETPTKDVSYNESNGKFVIVRNAVNKNNETVFTMTFKVNDAAAENINIKLTDINVADGDKLFGIDKAETNVTLTEEPAPEEFITSTKYIVGDTDISKIDAKTKFSDFKKNVETNCNLVLTDKEGNVLGDDTVVATGMILKGGETLEYTLIVTGDINGNGEIDITDLGKAKLHVIEVENLIGIYHKAADMDYNNKIDVNDVAKIKLVLIGLE